jgi:hypothetical protein
MCACDDPARARHLLIEVDSRRTARRIATGRSRGRAWRRHGSALTLPGTILVAAALLAPIACAWPAGAMASGAGERVKLDVSFAPYRLGAFTSIVTGLEIAAAAGTTPSPVTAFELYLPAGAEIGSSSLGLAICSTAVLASSGPEGCPPNARIGSGSAIVTVPFGPELVQEQANIVAVMGPPVHEQVVTLLYAEARTPILAQLILPGELLPDSGVFGERLASTVPVTATLPGADDAAMTELSLDIDPPGLRYEKVVHERTVNYHPQGVAIPARCPRGGFPFRAVLHFQDGDTVTSRRTVPCPPSRASHRKGP